MPRQASQGRPRRLRHIVRPVDERTHEPQPLRAVDAQVIGRAVQVAIGETRVAAVEACAPFDYVISPVSPNMPARAEDPSPTNDPLRPLEHIGFTVPYNMSEQPAASVNCGYSTAGLPIGLQAVAPRYEDARALGFAAAIERVVGAR